MYTPKFTDTERDVWIKRVEERNLISQCRKINNLIEDWWNKELLESQLHNAEQRLFDAYIVNHREELENEFIQRQSEKWFYWDQIEEQIETDNYNQFVMDKLLSNLY